jgi:hypothetical protein
VNAGPNILVSTIFIRASPASAWHFRLLNTEGQDAVAFDTNRSTSVGVLGSEQREDVLDIVTLSSRELHRPVLAHKVSAPVLWGRYFVDRHDVCVPVEMGWAFGPTQFISRMQRCRFPRTRHQPS